MKYTNSHYAQALIEALDSKTESQRRVIVRNFLQLLRTHRASSRLARVIEKAEHYVLQKQGLKKVEIESASNLSAQSKIEIKKTLGKNILLHETVNPRILAGIRILIDGEILIDATGKRQLEKMLGAIKK